VPTCHATRPAASWQSWSRSKNLHRGELTTLERAEHIAEWVRITGEKQSLAQLAPVISRRADGRGGSVGVGINAAVRDLGIDRYTNNNTVLQYMSSIQVIFGHGGKIRAKRKFPPKEILWREFPLDECCTLSE